MRFSCRLVSSALSFALAAPLLVGCAAGSDSDGNPGSSGAASDDGTSGAPGTDTPGAAGASSGRQRADKPNIVLIVADDMGWGDLGAFGSQTNPTPHFDQLAADGQRWLDFYVTSSVCSPSRASLLTGRFQVRSGMYGPDGSRALFANASTGLPSSEVTIAEALKTAGYATGIFGKWHLGDKAEYLPTRQGFDTFFGVPYSHDIGAYTPLIEGEAEVEQLRSDEELSLLTKRFSERAIQFVHDHADEPFFLYVPHTAPHVPILPSAEFKGKSGAGDYADVIMEMDHYTGELVKAIAENGLSQDTLIIFTNDNGPWLHKDILEKGHAGTPAPFDGGKFSTFEGGFRVPTIMTWPGTVPPGDVTDLGQTTDLLPTLASIAGVSLSGVVPDGVAIDGVDLSPALLGTGPGPRNEIVYWDKNIIKGLRRGNYKVNRWEGSSLYDVTLGPDACVDDKLDGDGPNCSVYLENDGANVAIAEELHTALKQKQTELDPHIAPAAFGK